MGSGSEGFFQCIGFLIVIVATISVASIPFLGPIPAVLVFAMGASLYRSKGRW